MFEDFTTSNKAVRVVNTQANPVMGNKLGYMVPGLSTALVSSDDPISAACIESRIFVTFDEVEFIGAQQEERLADLPPSIQLMTFNEWMASKTSKKKQSQPVEQPPVDDQQNNDPQL